MNGLMFVVGALVTFRVAWLVTQDVITQPLRYRIDSWAKDHEEWISARTTIPTWRNKVAYLTTCVACSSVWVGQGAALALARSYDLDVFLFGLAFSGVAVLLAEVIDVLRRIADRCRA